MRAVAATQSPALHLAVAWAMIRADAKVTSSEQRALEVIRELYGAGLASRDWREQLKKQSPPWTKRDRYRLFVLAAWVANVDHDESPEEIDLLCQLRASLGLDPWLARHLHQFVRAARRSTQQTPELQELEAILDAASRKVAQWNTNENSGPSDDDGAPS